MLFKSVSYFAAALPAALAAADCYSKDQAYLGDLSVTSSGHSCLFWRVERTAGSDLNGPPDFRHVLDESHNYCRNPAGGSASKSGRPWCFTATARGYEWCDVPHCEEVDSAEIIIQKSPEAKATKTAEVAEVQDGSTDTPSAIVVSEPTELNAPEITTKFVCPEFVCDCDEGTRVESEPSENGCETCACVGIPLSATAAYSCPPAMCLCPPTHKMLTAVNDAGCDTCECVEVPLEIKAPSMTAKMCPAPLCICPEGVEIVTFENDAGCEECKCNFTSTTVASEETASAAVEAEILTTTMPPVLDMTGLNTLCVEEPCECGEGTQVDTPPDENGCQVCACVGKPEVFKCPLAACLCPADRMILTFMDNDTGCEKCKCSEPIVENEATESVPVELKAPDSLPEAEIILGTTPSTPNMAELTTESQKPEGTVAKTTPPVLDMTGLNALCIEVPCDCGEGTRVDTPPDEYGCETCACVGKPEEFKCPLAACLCPPGRNIVTFEDENTGCEKCKCSEPAENGPTGAMPLELKEPTGPPAINVCPEILCDCGNGTRMDSPTDENGCETCFCAGPPEVAVCPEPKCLCLPGTEVYNYRPENGGCETCKCVKVDPPVLPLCPEFTCDCGEGTRGDSPLDKFGCETCWCVGRPEVRACPAALCICPPEHEVATYTSEENGCEECKCIAVNSRSTENPEDELPESTTLAAPAAAEEEREPVILVDPIPTDIPCAIPDCRCDSDSTLVIGEDDNGCETCQCETTVVELPDDAIKDSILCPVANCLCLPGTELVTGQDDNGCETCQCDGEPSVCEEIGCACLAGQHLVTGEDENGCETCKCEGEPVGIKDLPVCPPANCICPDGADIVTETDDTGCETCRCGDMIINELPVEEIKDAVLCPAANCLCLPGTELVTEEDENGCESCRCEGEPIIPVKAVTNAADAGGDLILCPAANCICPTGIEIVTENDENGCESCRCEDAAIIPVTDAAESDGDDLGVYTTNCLTEDDPLGLQYTGTISVTEIGSPCQAWNSDGPAQVRRKDLKGLAKLDGSAHNNCRNPDGDAGGPWCYRADFVQESVQKEWHHCAIPKCGESKTTPAPYVTRKAVDSVDDTVDNRAGSFVAEGAGKYWPAGQCDGLKCWCVSVRSLTDMTGKLIAPPPNYLTLVPLPKTADGIEKIKADCAERFPKDLTPCQELTNNFIGKHVEKNAAGDIVRLGEYDLSGQMKCKENGEFEEHQVTNDGTPYCVDFDTGETMVGYSPSRQGCMPETWFTPCRREKGVKCTEDGRYELKQCDEDECWCVLDENTGEKDLLRRHAIETFEFDCSNTGPTDAPEDFGDLGDMGFGDLDFGPGTDAPLKVDKPGYFETAMCDDISDLCYCAHIKGDQKVGEIEKVEGPVYHTIHGKVEFDAAKFDCSHEFGKVEFGKLSGCERTRASDLKPFIKFVQIDDGSNDGLGRQGYQLSEWLAKSDIADICGEDAALGMPNFDDLF